MKSILVYSGADQIGDAIIKLPFLYYLRKEFPDDKIIWMSNLKTAYKKELNFLITDYIDEIWDNADLNFLPWKKISDKYPIEELDFDLVIDTRRLIKETLVLKRIKTKDFISSSCNWLFSTIRPKKTKKIKQYYLDDLLELITLYSGNKINNNFSIEIPNFINNKINKYFLKDDKYIGFAPGAGLKHKIWDIKNYVDLAKYFQNKGFKIVFFLGPLEHQLKDILTKNIREIIYPEEIFNELSGIQVVMGCTKFLACAITNDSGTSHMLSTNLCHVIKLHGKSNAIKFTPSHLDKIHVISSADFGSKNINKISLNQVIKKVEEVIDIRL